MLGDLAQADEFSPGDDNISDIGAQTADQAWLYNQIAANLNGLLIVAFALGLWRALGPGWLARLGVLGLAILGVTRFLEGFLRLDCGGMDDVCENTSWQSEAHGIESGIASALFFLVPPVLAFAFRRLPEWRDLWLPTLLAVPVVVAVSIPFSLMGDGAAPLAGAKATRARRSHVPGPRLRKRASREGPTQPPLLRRNLPPPAQLPAPKLAAEAQAAIVEWDRAELEGRIGEVRHLYGKACPGSSAALHDLSERARLASTSPGFVSPAARGADGNLCAFAYGWSLEQSQWWVYPPLARALRRARKPHALLRDAFVIGEPAVAPEVRGRGLGRALLERLLERPHAKQVPAVLILVDGSAGQAAVFYRTLGFADLLTEFRFSPEGQAKRVMVLAQDVALTAPRARAAGPTRSSQRADRALDPHQALDLRQGRGLAIE